MRNSLFSTVVVVLLSAAPLVQAGTVTTNDYKADNTDSDINKSCKDLDLDSTGYLTGTCNPSKTASRFNLEAYAECQGGTLQWGSGGFIDNLSVADITVSSGGNKYLLTGTCTSPSGATDTAEDNLQLDGKVYNSKGSFSDTTGSR